MISTLLSRWKSSKWVKLKSVELQKQVQKPDGNIDQKPIEDILRDSQGRITTGN